MTLIRPDLGITVIPGKLFLHCFHKKPADSVSDHYFLFDELPSVKFEPISRENGPSNLPQIAAFMAILREKLLKINKQIHICCSLGSISRVNCIFLLCLFLILERDVVQHVINQQANKVYPSKYSKPKPKPKVDFDNPLSIFQGIYPPIEEYNDAIASPFSLTLSEAIGGVMKAVSLNWFDHNHFDTETYHFYLAPENGFMSWIVPNRLLVLAAPGIADAPLLFDMLPLFRKWRIKTVVSFSTEARGFEDLQRVRINSMILDVAQDTLPAISEVMKFIDLCNQTTDGAVAICSLNGLGRGPLFAALWLVHSFGFSPKEAIGWVRTARQGAIYGVQQDFIMRMDRTFHPTPVLLNLPEKVQSTTKKKNSQTRRHIHPLTLTYLKTEAKKSI